MTSINFEHPLAAEQAFYQAFTAADPRAMRQVWESDAEVICAHPMGAAIQGLEPIMESFAQIFSSGQRLRFIVDRVSMIASPEMAISVVYEHILGEDAQKPHPPILVTNAYRRGPQGWRMVLHQASPAVMGEKTGAQTLSALH